jgi:hypothetical protein
VKGEEGVKEEEEREEEEEKGRDERHHINCKVDGT